MEPEGNKLPWFDNPDLAAGICVETRVDFSGMAIDVRELRALPLDPEIEEELTKFEDGARRYIAGEIDDDVFRVFRLNQGIYGQRQGGYNQMLRVKIPYGRVEPDRDAVADPGASALAHAHGEMVGLGDLGLGAEERDHLSLGFGPVAERRRVHVPGAVARP